MGGQWIIETGKNVPEPMLEMNKIKTLTTIYYEISHILEELMCGSYFDDVESIVGTIMAEEYHNMKKHGYCEKLLKLCEEFEDKHNKVEDTSFYFQYNFFFDNFFFFFDKKFMINVFDKKNFLKIDEKVSQ